MDGKHRRAEGVTVCKNYIFQYFAGNTEEAFNFYKSIFGGEFS
jgi:predicted 3-demethylubiquinone-9 3-methyltransferase (glyoxalase superfamily)